MVTLNICGWFKVSLNWKVHRQRQGSPLRSVPMYPCFSPFFHLPSWQIHHLSWNDIFRCFYFYPYQLRSFHLIYLLLDRKRFVKSKEIWKPGTNPLLSVVKVAPARSVLGSGREGRWNLSPSSFFHLLVSLRNRTVERRGRQNAWVWQTWRGYYLRVLSGIYLTLLFLALLQKDLFKGMWSLAEGFFHENYCHACHTRFSAVFPLPSGCVSSLMSNRMRRKRTLITVRKE